MIFYNSLNERHRIFQILHMLESLNSRFLFFSCRVGKTLHRRTSAGRMYTWPQNIARTSLRILHDKFLCTMKIQWVFFYVLNDRWSSKWLPSMNYVIWNFVLNVWPWNYNHQIYSSLSQFVPCRIHFSLKRENKNHSLDFFGIFTIIFFIIFLLR